MKQAAVWSIRATKVSRFGPTNFIACVEANVANKKMSKAPVTCKATSIAYRSLRSEKKGVTKVTDKKPRVRVKLARRVLLLRNPVSGT